MYEIDYGFCYVNHNDLYFTAFALIGNLHQLILFFTLFMRFVAIRLPICPKPIKPTFDELVDIIRARFGVNLIMRNAILILLNFNFECV